MLDLVKTLCLLNGVSSCESKVRSYIAHTLEGHVDSLRVDTLGNLIVFKKGKKHSGPKLMLTAHMDEVGFMVKKIESSGFLRFGAVGGIDRRTILGKRVAVGEMQIPGVIGLKAYHLVSPEEEKYIPKLSDMYIDIGAQDEHHARSVIKEGDPIAFDSDCVLFGDGLLKAKAIDDRFGCAVMMKLAMSELPMDCTFAFTVQEEVGCRGAFGAAFSERPDIALVLEGTTSADIADMPAHKKVTILGDGPVIGFMDSGTIYDRTLFEMTRGLAEEAGIPWQIKKYIAGGTDASAIQRSRAGVRVASISAPVRYIHTASSVASTSDMMNGLRLAELFVSAIARGKGKEGK